MALSVFSRRTAGYKLGLFGLFLVFVLFLVGFASPFWIYEEVNYRPLHSYFTVKQHEGLWSVCRSYQDDSQCAAIDVSSSETWFHAARVLQCVGLAVCFAACVNGVYSNACRSVPRPFSRALEALAVFAGLCGFTGAMVYVGKLRPLVDLSDNVSFSWAMYMDALGSAGMVLCGILVAVTNKPLSTNGPAGGMIIMSTITGQHTVQANMLQSNVYPSAPPAHDAPLPAHYPVPPQAGYPASYPPAQPPAYQPPYSTPQKP